LLEDVREIYAQYVLRTVENNAIHRYVEDVITGMLSSTAQAAELVQYYRHQQQEQAEQPRKLMIILVFPP
jgi:hypothetical protein